MARRPIVADDHGLPGDQRRRRHRRASDPGPARRGDHAPSFRAGSTGSRSRSAATSGTAASPGRTPSCCPGSAPRCASPGRLRCCPTTRRVAPDRRGGRRRRRGDDAARPARAARGGSRRRSGRISRPLRPDRESGCSARRRDAVVMHPGPINRGVEIDGDARRPSDAVADHAAGRNGRGGADGLPRPADGRAADA